MTLERYQDNSIISLILVSYSKVTNNMKRKEYILEEMAKEYSFNYLHLVGDAQNLFEDTYYL